MNELVKSVQTPNFGEIFFVATGNVNPTNGKTEYRLYDINDIPCGTIECSTKPSPEVVEEVVSEYLVPSF